MSTTKPNSTRWSWIQLYGRRAARTGILLVLLTLSLPAVVQAQFSYTTNAGTITITGYYGPGGDVIIPDTIEDLPVTRIGGFAFFLCTNVTSVTISTNVLSIDSWAFGGCRGLTNLTIPYSVTSIGAGAFNDCASLPAIMVTAGNASYTSVDGVLFNQSVTALIQCPGGKGGAYTIPSGVTSIGQEAFFYCEKLTSVTIPDSVTTVLYQAFYKCTNLTTVTIPGSVTNIGDYAFCYCCSLTHVTIPSGVTTIGMVVFAGCISLTSVTIPNSVTTIGRVAFRGCTSLAHVTIPSSVTRIEDSAFEDCPSLVAVYFSGNAPSLGGTSVFYGDNNATVYYLAGTTGWEATFGGRPTVLLNPPTIQTSPQTQTAELGSAVAFRLKAAGDPILRYQWFFNGMNSLSCTNYVLQLADVEPSQAGAYTVVVTNAWGAMTSPPALLNVIAPVERRQVPGVKLMGEAGSLLNVDYANALGPTPTWLPLDMVSLAGTSQYCFDLTLPLPPQRYYRAWQTGTPGAILSLELQPVPAITLTGSIGNSVRVDGINRYGPIDAWFTLDTVTLTNTSQLYFDVSAPGQPQRLYRLVPVP